MCAQRRLPTDVVELPENAPRYVVLAHELVSAESVEENSVSGNRLTMSEAQGWPRLVPPSLDQLVRLY